MKPILFHGGGYNAFSNLSSYQIDYEEVHWPTSEHAYQAMKFTNPEIREKIRLARSAYDAKQLALEYAKYIRQDWQEINLLVMREILLAKVTQNPHIKEKLLETGNSTIIEDTEDSFWGRGVDGNGKNMLGVLLMEIRESTLESGTLA